MGHGFADPIAAETRRATVVDHGVVRAPPPGKRQPISSSHLTKARRGRRETEDSVMTISTGRNTCP